LHKALDLLKGIDLQHTNDTETVSLAGAVEKRLYEAGQGEDHLAAGLEYYQRGYFLLHNRYHGINLALMTDYRSLSSLCTTNEDRVADMVIAKRIRREVLAMCDKDWNDITTKQSSAVVKDGLAANDAFVVRQQKSDQQQLFWILANRTEACFALGDMDGYNKALNDGQNIEHEGWMMDSMKEQIEKLKIIKQKQAAQITAV
jgi:hypothetical protein